MNYWCGMLRVAWGSRVVERLGDKRRRAGGGGVGKCLVKRVVYIKDGGGAESRGGCFP